MIGRAGLLVFLLVAGASPAFADAKSEAMLRDFVSWVDSSPEWSASVSVVRSDGDETIAEGMVFTRVDPRVSISIESLKVTGLTERDGGGFKAAKIEMSSAGMLTETSNVAIPSASVDALAMPSFAGVSFDPHAMMTSIARFYSTIAAGSFQNFTVPEIDVVAHQDVPGEAEPVESRIVYRNLVTSGLQNGVMAHQEIGPISASGGTSSEKFQFEIEKLEADRMDFGAVAHVLDPSQYRDGRGDGVWRPVMGRAAYHGLKGSGADGTTFSLGEVAIENIDARQTDEPVAASLDRLFDPAIPSDAKNDLALDALTSMSAGWRVGTVRVSGVEAAAPEGSQGNFSLGSMTLTGWSSAGFDSFILKAIKGGGPQGIFSLDSLEIAGFVAPDVKTLVRFAGLDKNAEINEHAEAIRKTFAALPRLSHLGLENLVAGMSEADSVSLDSFSLDFRDWNDIFAGSTDIKLDGLKVPKQLFALVPEGASMLEGLGYDDIVFGMSMADRWDPQAGTDDATWTFMLRDAADLELKYTLAGLTLDWLTNATSAAAKSDDTEGALMEMLKDLQLTHASVAVTDHSLLDRGFKVAAEKQNLSAEGAAYREQMRAALPFIISAAAPPDLAKLVTEPLQDFMAGGQRLLVDLAPLNPLSIFDLVEAANGDPMQLPNKLNLSLRSEPP